MEKLNLNSFIALGGLLVQIVVTVITVTTSAADIKSDVAVLKTQIAYISNEQQDFKRRLDQSRP